MLYMHILRSCALPFITQVCSLPPCVSAYLNVSVCVLQEAFILLDLIGAANPTFHDMFRETTHLFQRLARIGEPAANSSSVCSIHNYSEYIHYKPVAILELLTLVLHYIHVVLVRPNQAETVLSAVAHSLVAHDYSGHVHVQHVYIHVSVGYM